jgi:hypothetical protein
MSLVRRGAVLVGTSLALALGCAGCGGSATSGPLAAQTPPTVPAPRHACPASDAVPRRVLDRSPGPVLVPGHPTAALICRYTGLDTPGLHGRLAGALAVVQPTVVGHLSSEFDALPPLARQRSCPAFGGRSELFVFRRAGASTARVLLSMDGCIPVTNGQVVRNGLALSLDRSEAHWPDEGLL